MRIDSPKGIKSWLIGFFSGSFKGNLDGTASYAITASYVENLPTASHAETASYAETANDLTVDALSRVVDDTTAEIERIIEGRYVKVIGNENITGSLTISGSRPSSLTVLGRTRLAGDVDVTGTMNVASTVNIGSASLQYRDDFLEVKF